MLAITISVLCTCIFCSLFLTRSLRFVNNIRGVTRQVLLSYSHYGAFLRCHRNKMHIMIFPDVFFLQSTCVDLVCMQRTPHTVRIIRGYAPHSAITLYTDDFVSGFNLDLNKHTRNTSRYTTCGVYLHILSHRYSAILLYRTIPLERYPTNIIDIDIDKPRIYRTLRYTEILDTIRNIFCLTTIVSVTLVSRTRYITCGFLHLPLLISGKIKCCIRSYSFFGYILQRGLRLCLGYVYNFRLDNPSVFYTAWLLHLH